MNRGPGRAVVANVELGNSFGKSYVQVERPRLCIVFFLSGWFLFLSFLLLFVCMCCCWVKIVFASFAEVWLDYKVDVVFCVFSL